MNTIRKGWRENGTPFFFHFRNGSQFIHLDEQTCQKYDSVSLDEYGHTCLDSLVDVSYIYRCLQRVDDALVKSSVLDALQLVINNTNYIFSISQKKSKL